MARPLASVQAPQPQERLAVYEDGPGSITPYLNWRTPGGEFELQQGAIVDGRARHAPSPAFAQRLATLAG